MNQYLRELALHGLQKNVEEYLRPDRWLVFEHYEIIPDGAGNRYIYAPPDRDGNPNEIRDRLHPLSRTSAHLFMRFARWPEETGMDKKLDTKRNAEAAKAWAETYGVLGLNPLDPFISDVVNSRRITADYLGISSPEDEARGRRSYARGGPPYETVANFAFEVWEAHIAWRLYESVRSEGRLDEATVIQYMSTIDQWEADITA